MVWNKRYISICFAHSFQNDTADGRLRMWIWRNAGHAEIRRYRLLIRRKILGQWIVTNCRLSPKYSCAEITPETANIFLKFQKNIPV